MDNNRNVIEKFTGELREYISLGHFESTNLSHRFNQSDKFIFFDGNFNYCLYKLAP